MTLLVPNTLCARRVSLAGERKSLVDREERKENCSDGQNVPSSRLRYKHP